MEGCGHTSTDERGAEKAMDDYLRSIGLHRKKIAKDGSCLFRAVAEQVLHCQSLHTKVRAKCVEFLKQNRSSYEAFIEGDFEDYLSKLQDPQQWVGEVEISALAAMYKRDFLIFQEPGKPPVNITDKNFKDKVQLCFLNGNHYDSVYPIRHMKSSAVCQSLLYELLYEGVFCVERGALGMCQRTGRPSDLLSDDSMTVCQSSDESDVEADGPLWVENETSTRHSYRGRGRGRQLPERVRRSLNPTLFRNIDYDFWHKTKRAQQKMDYCIAAGMQYTVGDRCKVRLESSGRSYNATVKEVPPNSDMVVVHIEELGKKQVPLWRLRPPSEESSWSTVVKDKRLSNGHGGRGKLASQSSSGSQVAAPGFNGRVQKQHSWSPQVNAEEKGGAKPVRKSISLVESVKEAELLSKDIEAAEEEEEEIQLRDEQEFPALRVDGGKQGEKRKSQRNKTRSPDEDTGALSPSAGQRPKSCTPPLATTAAAPPSYTTSPTPPSSPALPRTCAAPTTKPTPTAAAVALHSKPSVTSGAPPLAVPCSASVFAFLTPVLPTASSPPSLPAFSSSSPTSSSSSLLPVKSSAPPLPSPTFIAPIAPSPVTAQGFLPSSSLHRASLPHSPSPPSDSSSSLPHHAAQTQEAPARSLVSNSAPSVSQNQSQVSESQIQTQTRSLTSLPQTHNVLQEMHTHVQSSVPHIQNQSQTQNQTSFSQPQSQTHFSQYHDSLPQTQTSLPQTSFPQSTTSVSHLQPQSQTHFSQYQASSPQTSLPQTQTSLPQTQTSFPQTTTSVSYLQPLSQTQTHFSQSQSEMIQVQPPHPAPGTSFPHPHLHAHPLQQPYPSLGVSASPTLQTPPQTESTQPESAAPPPSSQHFLTAHPPHPQSIPGAVPLQKLSQLYQDPLYPGFPQEEKGNMAPVPPLSSSRKGDDLPRDLNILRFFFNLGVKAFSMPLLPPYFYLLPLQQAYTLQPNPPSRSPSPTPAFPPSGSPSVHPESYAHYPPNPATPPQYGHQAPLGDASCPSEPSFNQTGFSVTQAPPHRMPCTSFPWQQHHMAAASPTNSSYVAGYPSSTVPYQVPPPQGYHPGPGTGRPLYPPTMSPYPPSSLAFQPSSTPEDVLMSRGVMEQLLVNNGDTVSGQAPGSLESLAAPANVANANSSRAMVVPSLLRNEQGESLTRTVLLVDPPLNNRPILALVSDDPVSMTTMKPNSSPAGSPSHFAVVSTVAAPGDVYHVHPKHYGAKRTGHASPSVISESLSVGCSTEDTWEESEGFKPSTLNNRGHRRFFRGARGRGGAYEGGRGGHRRRGEGFNHGQFGSSYRGRGY
nr:OTU domain-containing protein 4 [Solea senegalensis]